MTAPPEPPRERWHQRLLRRLTQRPGGDTIAASVQQSQNVVVGKNIVQIGTLVVPVLPLLVALAVVVAGVAGLSWWQQRGPHTMTDTTYNVAVVDFAELDQRGAATTSQRGAQFSAQMAKALKKQHDQSSVNSANVLIWYSALPRAEMDAQLGLITGATPEERRQQARVLAEQINANIVIYGVIGRDNLLMPEFYVHTQSSDEANWLAGVHELGTRPILISDAADMVAGELNDRATTMFALVQGLRLSSQGKSAQAYELLSEATATTAPIQGRELLLNFRGAAALFSAQQSWDTDPAAFERYTQEADTSFRAALAIKPNYVRALLGLGSVAKVRADYLLDTQPIAEAQVEIEHQIAAAIDRYRQAEANAPTAFDRAWSEVIPIAALGSAYRTQGDLLTLLGAEARKRADGSDAELNQRAEAAIDLAISTLAPVLPPLRDQGEYRLLGQSYLALGNALSQKAYLRGASGDASGRALAGQQAHDRYQECIDLANLPATNSDHILQDLVIEGEGGCRAAQRSIDERLSTRG